MTRHLAHQAHLTMPATETGRTEWAVEQAIRLSADYDEPGLLEFARVTTRWPSLVWADRIALLLDLSDECAYWENQIGRLDDRCSPAFEFETAKQEYAALLSTLAAGPLSEDVAQALAIVAEPVVPSGLHVVRGGA